jgi:hypothetical protein
MSEVFETLQDRYHDLVTRSERERDESFVEAARSFLSDARQAGAVVADPQERSWLRAAMRYVATLVAEAGYEVPRIDLLPLDRERWPTPPPVQRAPSVLPWWGWVLVGGAALVVLAGLIAAGGLALGAVSAPPTPTPPPPTPTVPTSTPTPTATSTPEPTATPSPTPTPTLVPAMFSDLTVAQGMLDEEQPFLVGDTFDWNTRSVYAVFEYAGMREGAEWAVVWVRNGEEVAREERVWDVERDGHAGMKWAVYFDEEGNTLPGGNYIVSLYLEDQLEAQANFRISFYIPPPP